MKSFAAAGLLSAVLAGCGGGGSSGSAQAPQPARTTHTSSASAAADHPQVGACHLDTAAGLRQQDDHTKLVPCSQQHNLETASVHQLYTKPTQSVLRGFIDTCYQDAAAYLHTDVRQQELRVFVDPFRTTQNGKPSVSCDIGLVGIAVSSQTPIAQQHPLVTRTSLRTQARSGDTATWHFCAMTLAATFRLTDCTKPHRVEAFPKPITLHLANDRYPSGGTDNNSRGDGVCRRAVSNRPDAGKLTVHSHWTPRAVWKEQGQQPTLYGVCWYWRTDGSNLPALH